MSTARTLGALKEAGFKFPEPVSVKAAKKYPVIAYVYPGPQTESVTKTFNPRSSSMSLAQYGFIVLQQHPAAP